MGDINQQQNQALSDILKELDGYQNVEAKVKVNASDSTAQFLTNKLTAGSNITLTEVNTGGIISIQLDVPDQVDEALLTPASDGYNVKVSSTDALPEFLIEKVTAGSNITVDKITTGGVESLQISAVDQAPSSSFQDGYSFKVSLDDASPGFLEDKLVAGTGVTFTTNDTGGNESITIDVISSVVASIVQDGYQLKISSSDGASGFLETKLVAGSNVTLTKTDSGGSEILTIDVPDSVLAAAAADGYNVKVSASDGLPEFLIEKIVAGSNVTIDKIDDGGVESLQVNAIQQDVNAFIGRLSDSEEAIQTILKDLDGYGQTEQEHHEQSSQAILQLRAAADGYVIENTFQENKSFWNEAIHHLTEAADSYGQGGTEAEHFNQLSDAIQTILKDLDGYGQTEQEHHQQISQAVLQLRAAADGYASDVTVSEHYNQLSESILQLRAAADGYGQGQTEQEHHQQLSEAILQLRAAADGYGQGDTEQEHHQQTSDAIQTILKGLDGYASDQTVSEHHEQLSEAVLQLRAAADGYTTSTAHRAHDQLVHDIAEDGYLESVRGSCGKIEQLIDWTSTSKTLKIREEIVTRDSNLRIATIVTNQYNGAGAIVETLTETITRNAAGRFVSKVSVLT